MAPEHKSEAAERHYIRWLLASIKKSFACEQSSSYEYRQYTDIITMFCLKRCRPFLCISLCNLRLPHWCMTLFLWQNALYTFLTLYER